MIELRGMTWNHPRAIDPLVAHARVYEQTHGVRITWDARSLEDFEVFPLDELAEKYDFLVIDHPHVGMACASGCLVALDQTHRVNELPAFANQAVGRSQESYNYDSHCWALAIDAAAQVAARRAGATDPWPGNWADVFTLAEQKLVCCALNPTHALMTFFSLCAGANTPCATFGGTLISSREGAPALERLLQLSSMVPPECQSMNPIDVYERMAVDERWQYAPLIFGYVNYAQDGFRDRRIEFGEIPDVKGSILGGTGVAVSARSRDIHIAVDFAFDLASAETQRGVYASSGGQPAHRAAWNDARANAATHDFFRNTIATLDHSYLRPRFDGYIAFQQQAGDEVSKCLKGQQSIDRTIERMNELFAHNTVSKQRSL